MRTQLLVTALAMASMQTTAIEIFGVEIPQLEKVNVEREPGMPLLHSEPKHLLGK
jgi:hypothetical protein